MQPEQLQAGAEPLSTAAAVFGRFVSVGMTPGAEGADWEGSCRVFQTERAGPQEGWWNQVLCLPCEWLLQCVVVVGVGQPLAPLALAGWGPHSDPELEVGLAQLTGGCKVPPVPCLSVGLTEECYS